MVIVIACGVNVEAVDFREVAVVVVNDVKEVDMVVAGVVVVAVLSMDDDVAVVVGTL